MDLFFQVEKHGFFRFSDRETWICVFVKSKNMDLRVLSVERNGFASCLVEKKTCAFFESKNMDLCVFGSNNMDPRVFRDSQINNFQGSLG